MKRGLVGIAQRRRLLMSPERHALFARDRHANLLGGFIFLFNDAGVGAGSMEQMTVQSPKIARDAQLLLIAFNAVQAGGLALIPKLGGLLAPAANQLIKTVVTLRGEMRRRARCHAFADRTAVDD